MSLEPLHEYVVDITVNTDKGPSVLAVNTLARSEFEARDKVHTKFMHLYPDLNNYSFGKKRMLSKPNPLHCN